ncbi:hypothetical protein SAY86_018067 [Trapa natans]|uniref:DYW domain-containing protein n=1 Tax=Trapa natans TaxID=22666 RepID=A0AAN7M2Y5_TRANT|nr:hypothetical protein SAY86_018067 [Trapa natans]
MQQAPVAPAKAFPYSIDIPRTLFLLEKCSNTEGIKQIHANMLKTGLTSDPTALRRLLAAVSVSPTTGELPYAQTVFDRITNPDTFMWNAMIRGYSNSGQPEGALVTYTQMICHSSVPHNSHTFPFLLKACCNPSFIEATLQLHGHIVKLGFEKDVFTLNALVHAYASAGRRESARLIFDTASERDAVTWNSIIDAYVKSGEVEMAYVLFNAMPEKNVVSWTTMISGLASAGMNSEALRLFHQMQMEGLLQPDAAALASALSACANLGAIEQGRYIHVYIERNNIKADPMLECGLINMYAKSGCIEEARAVFGRSKRECVSIWTAMITGLAIHGRAKEALYWYKKMQKEGIKPNPITLTAVLSACSHAGLVGEGRAVFSAIRSVHGWTPSMEHYGCLVGLLGRAGLLEEAKEVVDTMPLEPNAFILGTLLTACRIHKNLELGELIGERLIRIDSGHGGRYIHAASILSAGGKWEAAARVRGLMKENGVDKLPGISSITINGTIHEFIAGDNSHSYIERINGMWDRVYKRLRDEGYRPEIGALLLDLDDDEKEMAMRGHSEKLAIGLGLLATEKGVTLRIFKNLRVCQDCHKVAKMISKVYERRIVMRDKSRFHVFEDGECSCGDYW